MSTAKKLNYLNKVLTDNEVIERILNGEKNLFELLLRRNNQRLYRVFRSYINSEENIEDLMQETYIKSFKKLNQFNAKSSFSTWLIRIGINEVLQEIRKKQKKPIHNETDNIMELKDNSRLNPEKNMINKEVRFFYEKAIDQLPEKYRIVFMMHEIDDMSQSSISECLNISRSNVKVRLYRARRLLKDELYKLSPDFKMFEFGNSHCDNLVNKVMKLIN